MPSFYRGTHGTLLLPMAAVVLMAASFALAASNDGANDPINKAYVTMLVDNNGFMAGAAALGKSLQASRSRVSRIALVTPNVNSTTRKYIKSGGWTPREVKPITCVPSKTSTVMQETGLRTVPDSFPSHCTKFHVFNMVEYNKRRHGAGAGCRQVRGTCADGGGGRLVQRGGPSRAERLLSVTRGGGRPWYERAADDPIVGRLSPAYNVQIGPLHNHYMADVHGSLGTPFELPEPKVIHFVGVTNTKPWISLSLALKNRTKEEEAAKAPPRIPEGVPNLSSATWGMHLRWFHYVNLPALGFDWKSIAVSAPPTKSSRELILERYETLAAKAAELRAKGGSPGAKGGDSQAKESDNTGLPEQEAPLEDEPDWDEEDEDWEHDEL
eukprot:jgi/Mesvir1/10823/Mv07751-RA.1